METSQDHLLDILRDLPKADLKIFKWHLNKTLPDKFKKIPTSVIEDSDVYDTINQMVNYYKKEGAVEVTEIILEKMQCNQLLEELREKTKGNQGCSLASAPTSNPSNLREVDPTFNHTEESRVLKNQSVEHAGKIRIKSDLRQYACELSLDPNTAHNELSLSEGNRKVTHMGKQPYPDHSERFDWCTQVLCRESLTGQHYWEAEWSGEAVVAVAYKVIKRKGDSDDCMFGYNKQSWSLSCFRNSYIAWHNNQKVNIAAPTSASNRVGVYLDWKEGTLSFYSILSHNDAPTLLHIFKTNFTEPLYAGFAVWWSPSSVYVCEK